jgi:hypothetical protein
MPYIEGRKKNVGNGLKPLSSKVHRNFTRSLYHKTLSLYQNVKEHKIPPVIPDRCITFSEFCDTCYLIVMF